MKLFSIITVCLNAENEIEETIHSVLQQDFTDFEYIIQDGLSNDQTVKIAESFQEAFADKGISFRIVSQKDQGTYDAMNKARQRAIGKWILFMNAGDWFVDGNILSCVSRNENLNIADIIYGDVILRNHNLYKYLKARELEHIRVSLPFSHQSVFVKKELLDSHPFSLQYRICSDHRFFLQMYHERKKFSYLPIAISIFEINGVSSDEKAKNEEKLRVFEEFGDEEAVQKVKEWQKQSKKQKFMYNHIWRFVPKKLRQIRRDRIRKKAGWKTRDELLI